MKTLYAMISVALTGCVTQPTRDYIANPIIAPVYPSTQPNVQPFGSQANDYQLIMVNTPYGLVQKRCKVLNGQVVHCL